MIQPLDKRLNNHGAAPFVVLQRKSKRLAHGLWRCQIDRNSVAVVAIERLYHHRKSDPFGGLHGLLGAGHGDLFWHGQTKVTQNAIGCLFIRRKVGCDVIRFRCDRRLNAFLVFAVAQLDQAVFVQPHPRNIAFNPCIYQ